MDDLTPAAKATFDALVELGQGNTQEVREKSGKARSTTDKALKELADAGLIVEVDPGADPADGAPPRWQIASPVLDTITDDVDPHAEVDPATDPDADSDSDEAPARPARPADRKVLIVAGVLGDYPDGTTINVIADACGLGVATVARLLTAMAQADAARRIPADTETGSPEMWQPGEGKASQVDPNPAPERCTTCGQVVRANRPAGTPASTRDSGLVNDDGNEPLGRNVLRGWVLEFINAHPGHVFTPQDIANELTAQHHREISNGAVRNNCSSLAAAGQVQLVSEKPWSYTANPADLGDNAER